LRSNTAHGAPAAGTQLTVRAGRRRHRRREPSSCRNTLNQARRRHRRLPAREQLSSARPSSTTAVLLNSRNASGPGRPGGPPPSTPAAPCSSTATSPSPTEPLTLNGPGFFNNIGAPRRHRHPEHRQHLGQRGHSGPAMPPWAPTPGTVLVHRQGDQRRARSGLPSRGAGTVDYAGGRRDRQQLPPA